MFFSFMNLTLLFFTIWLENKGYLGCFIKSEQLSGEILRGYIDGINIGVEMQDDKVSIMLYLVSFSITLSCNHLALNWTFNVYF